MTQEARHLINKLNVAIIAALLLALAIGYTPWSRIFIRPVGITYDVSTDTLSLYRHTPFGSVPARTEITLRTTSNLTCAADAPSDATDDRVSDFFAFAAPPALRPCLDVREPVAVVWETRVQLAGFGLTPVVFNGLLMKVNR